MTANEVTQLLDALYDGTLTLDQVAHRFRQRQWPRRTEPPSSTYLEMATADASDPDPYIPASSDDVVAAYDRGRLTDFQYEVLIEAIAVAKRAEDEAELES